MEKENSIIITDYKPQLARAVAEMWNKSRDGWGGHSDIQTAEQIQTNEENSTNLKTYIALDGEEAVGYCGLSEYREDEGALYIPLLNVRTDYHGKKIGKKLVLTALQETIQRSWPRLDLNTWPGNTKAVPLYKKCGFFWEDREDSVHLMNFMPEVLNTPLFQGFFKEINWYEDSVREIQTKPDGEKNGEFEVYEYHWKKGNRFLKVGIEKTSRGICAVDTEQYSIKMELDHHSNVFGKSYPVRFIVENRTAEPLKLQIGGISHRNIEFTMDVDTIVEQKKIIDGKFIVIATEEEQNTKKTHPSVIAGMTINGEKIDFKTGIFPKAPVKCATKIKKKYSKIGLKEVAFIELENHCLSNVQLQFSLPIVDGVDFHVREWTISLKEKEKLTVEVPYTLKESFFFDEQVTFHVLMKNGETVDYNQRVSFPFNTIGCKLFGECQEYYHLFSGITHVAMEKESNGLLYERGRQNKSDHWFLYPKLGKPFSEEFSIKKADSVEFYERDDKLGMKLLYTSRAFPHITLLRTVELSREGLMNQYYEIANSGNTTLTGIHLNYMVTFFLADTYIPYNHQLIFNKGSYNHEVSGWDEKKVSENWLFSKQNGLMTALIWDEALPIHFRHWNVHYFEEGWNEIKPGESISSKSIWFGQQIFSSVEEVRDFAIHSNKTEDLEKREPISFRTKAGIPFAEKELAIVFESQVQRNTEADLSVYTDNGTVPIESNVELDTKDGTAWEVNVPVNIDKTITPVVIKGMLSSQHIEEKTIVFKTAREPIVTDVVSACGHDSYELHNGIFTIKAAPSFYPGIYSFMDKETEWLHSSFPTAKPKSWWNPWIGGISFGLEQLSQRKIGNFPSKGKFVTVTDQHGQEWEGIQITTVIDDHLKYKGLTYHQFAVTRPGLPVLAVFSGIEQNMGHHFYGSVEHCMINIHPTDKGKNVSVLVEGEASRKFSHHQHESALFHLNDAVFTKTGTANTLHFLPSSFSKNAELYMNQDVILSGSEAPLFTKSGDYEFRAPQFLVLSEVVHKRKDYKDLLALRFTVNREGEL